MADQLEPLLDQVMAAARWRSRARHLTQARELVLRVHDALGVTPSLSPPAPKRGDAAAEVPPRVVVEALREAIRSDEILRIPPDMGSIDQLVGGIADFPETRLHLRLTGLHG